MDRPKLNEITLSSVVPLQPATATMTIDVGAWDVMIEEAYKAGFILIEIDQRNRPIRAFQKPEGY